MLTQSITSLVSKVGETKSSVILGSLRNKIFFAQTNTKDAEMAADQCGKDMHHTKNLTFNENIQSGGFDALAGQVSGDSSNIGGSVSYSERYMHNIQSSEFMTLRTFESITRIFDGVSMKEPKKIYHKPLFVPEPFKRSFTPRTLPFKLLINYIEKEVENKNV